LLKDAVVDFVKTQGADMVGFTQVARWPEHNEVPPDFWPDAIWAAIQVKKRNPPEAGFGLCDCY
jgi:hypothetical protein